MIYVTGDTHGNFERFSNHRFHGTEDDCVIICGDFGGVWRRTKAEDYWLDWLNDKPYRTLFVDGNHENFDRLLSEEFPTQTWCGGKIKAIRDNVYYLMRGQVFTIQGKKIFTMGGARSHDIDGGILDPDADDYIAQLRNARLSGRPYRVNHMSWWEQELPSIEEQKEGLDTLVENNFDVDYIVSHCAPTSVQEKILGILLEPDALNEYFEKTVIPNVSFIRWFFGHYHVNQAVDSRFTALYERIIPIDYFESMTE